MATLSRIRSIEKSSPTATGWPRSGRRPVQKNHLGVDEQSAVTVEGHCGVERHVLAAGDAPKVMEVLFGAVFNKHDRERLHIRRGLSSELASVFSQVEV